MTEATQYSDFFMVIGYLIPALLGIIVSGVMFGVTGSELWVLIALLSLAWPVSVIGIIIVAMFFVFSKVGELIKLIILPLKKNNCGSITLIEILIIIIVSCVLILGVKTSLNIADARKQAVFFGEIKTFNFSAGGYGHVDRVTIITKDGKTVSSADVDISSDDCVFKYKNKYYVKNCDYKE